MDLLKPILLGYIRHGLTLAAGYLLAHGLIQQADEQILVSAMLALAGVAWSTVNKFIQDRELRHARAPSLHERSSASQNEAEFRAITGVRALSRVRFRPRPRG